MVNPTGIALLGLGVVYAMRQGQAREKTKKIGQEKLRQRHPRVARAQRQVANQPKPASHVRVHPVIPEDVRKITTGGGFLKNRAKDFLGWWERSTRGSINVLHPSLDPKYHVHLTRPQTAVQFA